MPTRIVILGFIAALILAIIERVSWLNNKFKIWEDEAADRRRRGVQTESDIQCEKALWKENLFGHCVDETELLSDKYLELEYKPLKEK